MSTRRIAAAVGILGALLVAPSAAAGPPPITTITLTVDFTTGVETFTAEGVVCPSGTAVSDPQFATFGGRLNRGTFTFHVVKTLTCTDGSGTFKLLVDAAATRTSSGTVGGFAAGHGTGGYEGLHGGGHLVGTFITDGIIDTYTGRLHISP